MFQKEYFGLGSIQKLKDILFQQKTENIFLVRGEKSYQISGAKKIIEPLLKRYKVFEFYDFEPNPKIEDVIKGIDKFKKFNIDLIIAVGGGSVIDMAKSINLLGVQAGSPREYITGKKEIKNCGKCLISIPTTAGSGSEATHFAVVYIDKIKYSLKHKSLLPQYAIIDPQFTFNLSKRITASTGMDALCQAMESYWSINSNEVSKKYSKEAIDLIIKNLSLAVNKSNEQARAAMSRASNLAGKAINITQTTACHAISYPITSYFGVPHGHAAALTLTNILIFNSNVKENDILDKRGVNYVKKIINNLIKILDTSDVYEAKKIIDDLMKEIGLETKLTDLGINRSNMEVIIKNFDLKRAKNNPRKLNAKRLKNILMDLQ